MAIVTSMSAWTWAGDLPTDRPLVEHHAEEAFQRLEKESQKSATSSATASSEQRQESAGENVLIGHGQGDLSKGILVCQRVSELAARADLAKQIRVLVKERATDRVRERTGREPEQDIEVVREEVVQEYLQGVKIIDRRLDEPHKTCSATAIMPKGELQPEQASRAHERSTKP
jgi:hypothetical protein